MRLYFVVNKTTNKLVPRNKTETAFNYTRVGDAKSRVKKLNTKTTYPNFNNKDVPVPERYRPHKEYTDEYKVVYADIENLIDL